MKIDKTQMQTLVEVLETHRNNPGFNCFEYKALETLKHINSLMEKGYVFVPSELTEENGAKYALIGEFKEQIPLACQVCYQDEDVHECEICGGEGSYTLDAWVSWDNIKGIYAKAIALFTGEKTNEIG